METLVDGLDRPDQREDNRQMVHRAALDYVNAVYECLEH